METVHKSRGKNFTDQEKQIFLKIFESYKHIFQDKRTDIYSRRVKNRTWQEITNRFNNVFNSNRTQIQLQFFYKNLKQRERQQTFKLKTERKSCEQPDIFIENGNSGDLQFSYYEPRSNDAHDTESVYISEPECTLRIDSDNEIDLQIKQKQLEMINNEASYKQKLYTLELQQAMKKNKLLDLEIAIKQTQLQLLQK